MDIQDEKKNLLLDMISFATIDGHLQKKDFDFLFVLSNTLNVERGGFMALFQQPRVPIAVRTKLMRLQQFYRLALLMQKEGNLHTKDAIVIKRFAITMGLNPEVAKNILKRMKNSPTSPLTIDALTRILNEE